MGLSLKKILGDTGTIFQTQFGWGSYIVSDDKTAYKKIQVFVPYMNFLSPEVALLELQLLGRKGPLKLPLSVGQ